MLGGCHTRSVSPHLSDTAVSRLALGANPLQLRQSSASQPLQTSQAPLGSLRVQPEAAEVLPGMADCVVAVCFSGGWASGVVVHSSGIVLTVAHAVRAEPDTNKPSQGSIQSSNVSGAEDLAQEGVAEASSETVLSQETDSAGRR